ncbi:hypothetical protein NOR_02935 [Metarhizium rileyi]|uniref:Uncharacterized protein n=1 Tax=Metarhizium rileyi (strain RCEF 4871) TaxID=1649241 RepID=A0A167G5G7_METRR|nr:hypothetical protein NOR_02935 [Metarhizium rileyi RCEF 4871]
MVSKTYTARELLRMRQVSTSKDLYDKLCQRLNDDTAFGEIFRMSPERTLPLIQEEASDNVSHTEPAAEESSVRQLDGTDAEWKYRGRTESEHGEHHPIGAPAGLTAQKDEGFQRFYKAVVSPTHVRVTAGGRIVPNTRGSSSPTAKWTKEKVGFESTYTHRPASQGLGEVPAYPIPAALSHQAFGTFPPLFPGFFPGMPAALAPGAPQPYPLPWQMGFGMGNSFGMVPGPTSPTPAVKPNTKPTEASGTNERQCDSTHSDSSSPVRISPPENFDPTRPYYVHGQWIAPGGGPFYHYGMTPLPGYPVGGPAIMHPRYTLGATMQSMQAKPDRPMQMHTPVTTSSSVPSLAGHSTVPISSIRPSEITKKQIESLRSTLRYYEDQLQYNKHQIDEKSMEHQADMVRDQIQQFEKTLKSQLDAERKSQYPKPETQRDSSSSSSHNNGRSAMPLASSEAKSDRASRQSSHSQVAAVVAAVHAPSTKPQKNHDQYSCRRSSTLKSVKSASAPVSAKITPDSSESSEPTKKSSTLPVSAALAPPFHPRADSAASVPLPLAVCVSSGNSTEDTDYNQELNEDHSAESIGSENFGEKPYLIGRLAEDRSLGTDSSPRYSYSRELTEDELRARHMYWGNAPRHLQKGLPKFDGKDFYPPSPAKSQRLTSTLGPTTQNQSLPRGSAEIMLKTSKVVVDPFRSLGRATQRLSRSALGAVTQSENLTSSDELSEDQCKGQQGTSLSNGPAGCGYEDFRKALIENADSSADSCKDKSSDDDDSTNILFRGRKYMATNSKTRNEIWQSMWKRSKSSATAVPGTVSSMTARGVLPNYAGHATASLTPTIANASTSPKGVTSKLSPADSNSPSIARQDKVETRPLFVSGV